MAIKFPDSITQNNSNYITVSAIDGDVQGLYFVADVAARDAIGGPDAALDNHRALGTVVYTGGVPYYYQGADISNAQWTDTNNWLQVGGTDLTTIDGVGDVDTSGATEGDLLQYDGTEWVPVEFTQNTFSTVIVGDAAYNIDIFSTDYTAVQYTYVLKNAGTGTRTGTFAVTQDNGEVEFTDFSTNSTGTDTEPEITATLVGSTIEVDVTNGDGYTFKATATRL